MVAIAYVNGEFVEEPLAKISIFDRGFLFGDGVYEVVPVVKGRLINRAAHRERLMRSLSEIRLVPSVPIAEIETIQDELVKRNAITEGRVYMQVTRGPAERDFAFPKDPAPTLIMFARNAPLFDTPAVNQGIKVVSKAENRWARRDIKTVMLLPGSLAKQEAIDGGFDDVWFVENGEVTEGSANNAYIVKDRTIYTRPLSNDILAGCTRRALLRLTQSHNVAVVERAFTLAQAHAADEAFLTSASATVTPVVQIDSVTLGDGTPGELTKQLQLLFREFAEEGGAR